MTFGILRPVILLPTDLQSPRDVLLHELAHIKRKDCFVQCVVHIACALYWFNPLLWYASRRMRIERERACDDLVLQAGCKPSDYAQQLLTIAADLPVSSPRMAAFAGIAMARKSNLEGRMLAILDPKRNRKTLTRLGIAIGALLIACIVVPIAMLRAEQGEDPAIPSSALLGKDPVLPKTATKIKEAFDTFRVAMTSTKPPDRTITIKGDGTFTFKMQTLEKVPGNEKRLRRSKTPYVARYRLSPGHLRELTQLLKAANWLTLAIPKGSIPADSTKYAMTLTRSGQQHERIYHERDKPKAYIDLVRFLRRINRQEDLYYAITHTDGSFSPGHNLSVELDGVMGAKSMSRPYAPVLDYHRLVPPYAKILRRPMGVELQAADGAKLMGYLKLESQRLTLEALALDLSSYDVPPELRKAAVKALGMMGAGRSLGALKEAAQTGDFWLRNDVAEVLLTAEQVLKKQDKFVASVRFIETTATEKWTMHTWNIKRPTDMKVFAGWVHQRADETMAEHVGGGGNNRRGSDDIRLSLTYWREGEFVHWKIKREVLAPGESGGLEITSKTKIARDSELKIHSPNLLLKIDSKAYRPLIQIDVMSKGQLQSRLSYVIRTAKFFDEKHEGLLGADDPVKRILNVGE